MSDNESGDEQGQLFGSQSKSGLSVSREEAENRAPPPRSRRGSGGAFDKVQRAARVDDGFAARWFIPAAGLAVVLFLVLGALIISQARSVGALETEVEQLREQVAASGMADQRAQIDRLLERVEELNTRLGSMSVLRERLQALQDRADEQGKTIEALAGRLESLSKPSGAAPETPGSDAAGASGQAGGEWVVNLITVGDRESAVGFQERAEKLGIETRIESITRGDETLQRVVAPGFASEGEAQSAASDMKQKLELADDPWITRQ